MEMCILHLAKSITHKKNLTEDMTVLETNYSICTQLCIYCYLEFVKTKMTGKADN